MQEEEEMRLEEMELLDEENEPPSLDKENESPPLKRPKTSRCTYTN